MNKIEQRKVSGFAVGVTDTNKFNDRKINRNARDVGGFMSGVLVLSLSTLAVKIIGLAVKIPLLSTLGAVGMGYFNSAYEIYAILCVISTAGLPTALAMLVSANRERGDASAVRKIYSVAMGVFLSIGFAGSLCMLVFARPLSEAIGNADAYLCILAISPALLFICVSSAVRGYFQGFGYMTPTAVSQLIEAVGKLVLGVGFAVIAVRRGKSTGEVAAFAVLGLTIGIIVSCAYLLIIKRFGKVRIEAGGEYRGKGLLLKLLRIAFPITVSSAVISSCRIVDMALILRRLQSGGLSAAEANVIYGSYTTLAVPVFSLIPSLITPISLSVVPRLVAAVEGKDGDGAARLSDRAIRLTVLLALPASMGLSLYSRQILELLFSGETEAISIATPLLSVLGTSVLFSGLITTTNAILQAHGHTVFPILSMGAGTVIKTVLAYMLIGMPRVGALGAPVSTLACDITVVALNLYMIGYESKQNENHSSVGKIYVRPLLAATCAMTCSYAVFLLADLVVDMGRMSFIFAFLAAVASYVMFAVTFGCVDKEDISDIPLINKIISKIRIPGGAEIKRKDQKNDY